MGTAIAGHLKVPHVPVSLHQVESQAGRQAGGEGTRNSKGRIPTSFLVLLETALGLRGLQRPFNTWAAMFRTSRESGLREVP